jgi:hypothetical protein
MAEDVMTTEEVKKTDAPAEATADAPKIKSKKKKAKVKVTKGKIYVNSTYNYDR